MKNIYLSIVIPCYNEERNLRLGALEKVAHFLAKKKFPWEVIIVDDGSSDSSVDLIDNFIKEHEHFRLVKNPHQGKAATVVKGVKKALGKYVLFTDLDQATPIDQLDKLMPWFEKGYDLTIGSRNTKRKGAPFLRRTMAIGFIFLRNLLLNLDIADTQCGFKAFTKTAVLDIFSRLEVYGSRQQAIGSTVTAGFDVELLYIAKKLGYKIKEVPVEWHYQETRRVNPIKDSWEGLADLVRIRWNSISRAYEL